MNLKKFLMGNKSATTPAFLPLVLLLLVAMLLLSGCSSWKTEKGDLTPTTVEVTQYVAYHCGQPPGVTYVDFSPVVFRLVEVEGDVVWLLSAQQYANLGSNMSDIIQAAKEMRSSRNFWRDCVLRSLEWVDQQNAAGNSGP